MLADQIINQFESMFDKKMCIVPCSSSTMYYLFTRISNYSTFNQLCCLINIKLCFSIFIHASVEYIAAYISLLLVSALWVVRWVGVGWGGGGGGVWVEPGRMGGGGVWYERINMAGFYLTFLDIFQPEYKHNAKSNQHEKLNLLKIPFWYLLGVKNNFCYFSSLITIYYIHEW